MATTAKGTPYVESTDLVANYPAASLALANHIDDFTGKFIQIVRATDTTSRSTSSATFVDVTGMSVTITPQNSTSAVIILASFLGFANGSNPVADFAITDASNNTISGAEKARLSGVLSDLRVSLSIFGYATPATTSATTYKLRFLNDSSTTTAIRNDIQTGQMYAIEVSA